MLKKRDIEHITNTLDSYFYYYAWEGEAYVKRQLKGISGELSINNRELMEYVWEGSDRALAVCILYQMGQSLIRSFWDTHPVLQDYMADKLDRFRDVVNGISDRWKVIQNAKFHNETLKEEDTLIITTEQQEKMDDFVYLLDQLQCHVEIGRRLGLPGKWLGVYDVLMEYFYEGFDPDGVDAAKELSEWIFAPHRGRSHQSLVKELVERVEQVQQKYHLRFGDKKMVISYIGLELTHWVHLYEKGGDEC